MDPTMQSFHFPGTTVNFSHAMVTPGDIQRLEDGFVFVPRGQPFLWANPDFPVLSMDQVIQGPDMSQAAGGSLTGMGVPQLVDAAQDASSSHHAFSGVSSQHAVSGLHQEAARDIDTSRASRALNPPHLGSPPVTSFPGPFAWGPLRQPTPPRTYAEGGQASASFIDDGSSALGKWYGDGTGVGTMSFGGSHEVGAISSPARSATSMAADQRIRDYSGSLSTYTQAAAPPPIAFSNNPESTMRMASERWNRQPPHTTDGTFARQQLSSHPEVEHSSPPLWQDYPSSAASGSSASHATYPMNTGFAIAESNNPGTNSVAATTVQPTQLSGPFAFGIHGGEGNQGQSHQSERVHRAYPGFARYAAQAPPHVFPGRQPGHSHQVSPWPAFIDPPTSTQPSMQRYAAPPAFVPAFINENFAFPARTSPSSVESHSVELGRGAEYPPPSAPIEEQPPKTGTLKASDDPLGSDKRSRQCTEPPPQLQVADEERTSRSPTISPPTTPRSLHEDSPEMRRWCAQRERRFRARLDPMALKRYKDHLAWSCAQSGNSHPRSFFNHPWAKLGVASEEVLQGSASFLACYDYVIENPGSKRKPRAKSTKRKRRATPISSSKQRKQSEEEPKDVGESSRAVCSEESGSKRKPRAKSTKRRRVATPIPSVEQRAQLVQPKQNAESMRAVCSGSSVQENALGLQVGNQGPDRDDPLAPSTSPEVPLRESHYSSRQRTHTTRQAPRSIENRVGSLNTRSRTSEGQRLSPGRLDENYASGAANQQSGEPLPARQGTPGPSSFSPGLAPDPMLKSQAKQSTSKIDKSGSKRKPRAKSAAKPAKRRRLDTLISSPPQRMQSVEPEAIAESSRAVRGGSSVHEDGLRSSMGIQTADRDDPLSLHEEVGTVDGKSADARNA